MKGVVVGKLSLRKETNPIMLLVTYRALQLLFKNQVNSLCLSIGLWITCARQILKTTDCLEKTFPEMGKKLRFAI